MSTALITGASFGLGAAYARALAQRNFNLILVARSQDRLEDLGTQLTREYGIQVLVIAQDLTAPDGVDQVLQQVETHHWAIDWLINNAGFGDYGPFVKSDRRKQQQMVQLNIAALVDMTHQVLPQMVARKQGVILNIASIAAFWSMPYLSLYAATKAFVLQFSEALWAENQDQGVLVTAICPGPTQTRFFEVAGFDPRLRPDQSQNVATPESVVAATLRAVERQDPVIVTGWANKLLINVPRFLPREWLVKVIEPQFRPPT
ncbi:SDR family NAD(P)-dependent oxidoreductase [Spirulina subsalsa]|uniref:SDR family NAD(P)-dependent oxidoreductase n=1 Tax=Spirulina subsalsa TaxID=54311 RepID=UPI0002E4469C|nr:SDR family oxidoreductase [Spirulina subsalsa]